MKVKIFILFFMIFLFSCKNDKRKALSQKELIEKAENKSNEIKNDESKIDVSLEKDTTKLEKELTLKLMQGIWNGEKDINMSKAYRIINKNKVLEIVCIEGICDGTDNFTHLEFSYVGFIDSVYEKTTIIRSLKINDLKNQGKYMIYANKKNESKLLTEIHFDENYQYNSDLKYYKTILSSNYMSETIYYGRFDKQDTTAIFYKKPILNNNIFSFLKKQSKKDNRDYIKEFNIKGFSSKVKVTTDKTYFYNDYKLKNKRKAFLVKGDIAYLESVGDNQVQVYFDGKVITKGYLKLNDVEILE